MSEKWMRNGNQGLRRLKGERWEGIENVWRRVGILVGRYYGESMYQMRGGGEMSESKKKTVRVCVRMGWQGEDLIAGPLGG